MPAQHTKSLINFHQRTTNNFLEHSLEVQSNLCKDIRISFYFSLDLLSSIALTKQTHNQYLTPKNKARNRKNKSKESTRMNKATVIRAFAKRPTQSCHFNSQFCGYNCLHSSISFSLSQSQSPFSDSLFYFSLCLKDVSVFRQKQFLTFCSYLSKSTCMVLTLMTESMSLVKNSLILANVYKEHLHQWM